jgi:hypothetical protein
VVSASGAIQIVEPDSGERNALKATLQTMARKRRCFVEVLDDDESDSVYAWASARAASEDRCYR